MALQVLCQKHNISYIAADIVIGEGPQCPVCREEWERARAVEKARSGGLVVEDEDPPTLKIHVSDGIGAGDTVR